ncbi:hypothetical protein BDR07DRAFT_1487732 [Suillus spraguei]|nr:hypothetical protein BDR07DRAFT_1487732 [Suillus spraguei]
MSTSDIKIWCTWALAVTYEAGEYTKQKFNAEKTGGDPVIPSLNLDTDLVMAYKNPRAPSVTNSVLYGSPDPHNILSKTGQRMMGQGYVYPRC